MNALPRDVGAPLHHQISSVLRSAIASGRYAMGEYLPSETSLMGMFDVSRATVRRALTTLEHEALIDRRAGKGTRVIGTVISTQIRKQLRQIERGAAGTTVDVLEFGTALAPAEVAHALAVPDRSPLLRIVRVRYRDGVPLRHLTNYLPPPVGERLNRADVETGTLVQALSRYGHTVARAEDEVGATLADPVTAPILGIRVGDPLLEMARTLYDPDGVPLAFQWTLVSPDRFRLRIIATGGDDHPVSAVPEYGAFAPVITSPS